MIDDQVRSVVFGEGGPGNWDFTVASTGITGQEEKRPVYTNFNPDHPCSD